FAAMREMSIARKADAQRREEAKHTKQIEKEIEHEKSEQQKERTKQIEAITSGAGRQTKYQLAKNLGDEAAHETPTETPDPQVEMEQSAFKKHESALFWIMVLEACAAGLTFVLMSGLKSLRTYAATEDNRHKLPSELPLGTVVPGQYGDWIVVEENGRHVFAPLPLREKSPNENEKPLPRGVSRQYPSSGEWDNYKNERSH